MRLNSNVPHERYSENPYPAGFSQVSLPECEDKKTGWRLFKRVAEPRDVMLDNLRAHRDGMPWRVVPPGTYTTLTRHGSIVMSDTPAEAHENSKPFYMAARACQLGKKPTILLNGFGIGFLVQALLSLSPVASIRVIEKDPWIIKNVSRYYNDARLHVVRADAFKYLPARGEKFDVVWHDVWNDMCSDNLETMAELSARYKKHARWQGCWSQVELKALSRTGYV